MPIYLQASEMGAYFPANRIIDLADGDGEVETLDSLEPATQQVIDSQITSAEAEANAYLQGRFALPISPVPIRLKLAIGKMALYYLFEYKPETWNRQGNGRNPMGDQYDIQVEWLQGVKESELFVGDPAVNASDDILSTADDSGAGLVFGNGGLNEF